MVVNKSVKTMLNSDLTPLFKNTLSPTNQYSANMSNEPCTTHLFKPTEIPMDHIRNRNQSITCITGLSKGNISYPNSQHIQFVNSFNPGEVHKSYMTLYTSKGKNSSNVF